MLIDTSARHRLLLSLRSESAMGLRLVRASGIASVSGNVSASAAQDEAGYLPADHADELPLVVSSSTPQRVSGAVAAELFENTQAQLVAKVSSVTSSIDLPLMSTQQKTSALSVMNEKQVTGCTKCRLHETRTHTVFGEGDVDAKIFFIGEGPGETEDETGRPFVGRAGQLLDKMIGAMGLSRSQVFIANIVKCRPPNNRVPAPDEVETCTPYLTRQLEIIRPKVIVTLGLPAVKYMLGDPKLTMGKTRGTWQAWRGIKLMPTYHPSYVLRAYTEANRAAVWSDLQMVMKEIGMPTARAKPRS
jgi:DNA polymerase